ncbi:MAG: 23S rRNA (adenine(2503)-C(2))-methyltransferase RlmN [Deltaproteobacteria bacterium]|nr:23S rRNA (adenine(2503)-C(2))-methyltransferase RlmN [Deltaproteobacteria bacterium]
MKVDLKGLDLQETEQWITGLGFDGYRAGQLRQWLFKRLADSFEQMTSLSKDLRNILGKNAHISHLENIKTQVSTDGTQKYLFRLEDGHLIESVLIPERNHDTLCISSQAGCAMGCKFCLTANQGFKRNLTPSEIIDQVIQTKQSLNNPERLKNIVFMGMGEPLANYNAVKKALRNLLNEDGMNFSKRRITLSTCGLVPNMKKLGNEIDVKLAVSLNAADDKTRNMLMPVNREYPLKSLLKACKEFPLPRGERITFEYTLIKEVNDRDMDAIRLAELLSGMRTKINLIPLNPHKGTDMIPPSMERTLKFQDILIKKHFTTIIRKSRGRDISAACGQLSGDQEDC